jgi:predicted amidohydrolase
MPRKLSIGVVQMPVSEQVVDNVRYLARALGRLERRLSQRPALVVGVEFGIDSHGVHPIPDRLTDELGELARRHSVYLIPGTLKERIRGSTGFHNTAPVFSPEGELLTRSRKVMPWTGSLEEGTVPGSGPATFEVREISATVGVCICYDGDFPEITRTLTLAGAEVVVQPSMDADTLPAIWQQIRVARALENQSFFVYTNGVGTVGGQVLQGHSRILGPHGRPLAAAGGKAMTLACEVDLDDVSRLRREGTWGLVTPVKDLLEREPRQPFARSPARSPLGRRWREGGLASHSNQAGTE